MGVSYDTVMGRLDGTKCGDQGRVSSQLFQGDDTCLTGVI